MFKAILFDLGGVIINYSYEKMCVQLANIFHVETALIKKSFFEEGAFTDYERGSINTEKLLKLTCKKMEKQVKQTAFIEALSNIFSPNESVVSLVKKLKSRGYRLITLSNTNEAHFNFIQEHYPFIKYFDEKALSFKIGAIKPEPAIYLHAIKLAGCLPTECFYIDDLQENLTAAKKIGIKTHLFQTAHLLELELQKNTII